jgi:hypothetical protein
VRTAIKLILDNHSEQISKETRNWVAEHRVGAVISQLIRTGGRHHSGFGGRPAPQSAISSFAEYFGRMWPNIK